MWDAPPHQCLNILYRKEGIYFVQALENSNPSMKGGVQAKALEVQPYLMASPKGNCCAIRQGRGEISPRPFLKSKEKLDEYK